MPQTDFFDNFEGSIDGKTVKSFRKELRKAMTFPDIKERSDFMSSLLEKYDKFFTSYIGDVYNPSLKSGDTGDVLSDSNNVFATLDFVATLYIRADNIFNPYDKSYFATDL